MAQRSRDRTDAISGKSAGSIETVTHRPIAITRRSIPPLTSDLWEPGRPDLLGSHSGSIWPEARPNSARRRRVASSDESTIAAYNTSAGTKVDFGLTSLIV